MYRIIIMLCLSNDNLSHDKISNDKSYMEVDPEWIDCIYFESTEFECYLPHLSLNQLVEAAAQAAIMEADNCLELIVCKLADKNIKSLLIRDMLIKDDIENTLELFICKLTDKNINRRLAREVLWHVRTHDSLHAEEIAAATERLEKMFQKFYIGSHDKPLAIHFDPLYADDQSKHKRVL